MKPGTFVRFTEAFKTQMSKDIPSTRHVEEFGECVGIVEDTPAAGIHPEWGYVRWRLSGIRGAYMFDVLEVVDAQV